MRDIAFIVLIVILSCGIYFVQSKLDAEKRKWRERKPKFGR